MPELPEVETTRRGVEPHLVQRRIARAVLRRPGLRWPISPEITTELPGQRIEAVERRAKYLILRAETGDAILHLGMSGSLRVLPAGVPVRTHDHVDLELDDGQLLRFNDPRRFGSLHWLEGDPSTHPLLASLGPGPLSADFDADYLWSRL